MVAAQLLSGQSWPANGETISGYFRKLIQMGLVEQVRDEPLAWRITPLGEELDVDLFADSLRRPARSRVTGTSHSQVTPMKSSNARPKPMRKLF